MQDSDVSFINVTVCHYKRLFNKTTVNFEDIVSEDSIHNFIMRELKKMEKTEDSEPDLCTIYNIDGIDIDECEEFYILEYKEEENMTMFKICKTLLPLLKYISTLDWTNHEWTVISNKD